FELCQAFVPKGDKFFALISKYDDFLADIEKKPGYQAGDTLKLILPFLKAFGLTHQQMIDYSRSHLVLLPGAKETLHQVMEVMPTFIISTSYEPYLEALCQVTGFPFSRIYCTKIDMDHYSLPEDEQEYLRKVAAEIADMPMLEWEIGVNGLYELSPQSQDTIQRLAAIFWEEICSMEAGRLLAETKTIGGRAKARAVLDSLKITNNDLSRVMYLGDSITDVEALDLVRDGGGLSVSFNGNGYAVGSAEICCLSGQASIILLLAALFKKGGKNLVLEVADNWGIERLKDLKEAQYLVTSVETAQMSFPRLEIINEKNRERLAQESEAFRKEVRGIAIGSLG
ncbi:MAG: hypothetical protein Q8N82_05865, partial [Deltaproteobacteria bacterium]|nr:hypothetical protein [Deltaproteobacteria bacterium]